MRLQFQLLSALVLLSLVVVSQNIPSSFLNNKVLEQVDEFLVENPLSSQEKKPSDLNLYNYTFAIALNNLDIISEGKWVRNNDDEWIWLLRIKAHEAEALSLDIKNLHLKDEDKLFITNVSNNVYNISNLNENNSKYYISKYFEGDNLLVEYNPFTNDTTSLFSDRLTLNYVYKDIEEVSSTGFGASQDCEINANCNEEKDLQPEKRAVVRIRTLKTVGSTSYIGYCTGTIVANTDYDDTPYLLTADHCYNYFVNNKYEGASTEDLQQWVFTFNYDSPTCENPDIEGDLAQNYMLGASYKANAETAGDADSDFCLLELSNKIPENFNAFWAGWDNRDFASNSGYSYHHPAGDIKKINTYSKQLNSSRFDDKGPENTHWEVYWETGVTEGGSSGSPLFNFKGQIVGVLTGGGSSCTSTNESDFFGKISYSWTYKSDINSQLKHWLDPANKGLEYIVGYDRYGSKTFNFDSEISITPNFISNGIIDFGNIDPNLLSEVYIYDLKGSVIYENNNQYSTQIQLSLNNGLYLCRTKYDNKVSVNKILVVNGSNVY